MIKRKIFKSKLKLESVAEYKKYHKNVWPELQDAYRQAGYIKLGCFLNTNELLIYLEYDEDIFTKSKTLIEKNELQIEWMGLMNELSDSTFESVEYEEVFYMD